MCNLMFRTCLVLTLLSSVILPSQADELADLKKRVAALEEGIKSLDSAVNDKLSKQTENINKLYDSLKLSREENELSHQDLSDRIVDQAGKQQEILSQIMSTDENGEVYLTLNSIMNKSDTAREEVRSAVEQSIRKQGTLTIVNEMGTAQDIIVNHIQQRVHAGATLNLTVPVGTVSTQLPGQDVVNWTIGVPNYKQSVSIKPRYTAARVPTGSSNTSTWTGQPLYYETPLYYSDPWWGDYLIYR